MIQPAIALAFRHIDRGVSDRGNLDVQDVIGLHLGRTPDNIATDVVLEHLVGPLVYLANGRLAVVAGRDVLGLASCFVRTHQVLEFVRG